MSNIVEVFENNHHRYEKALKKGTSHINDQLRIVKDTIAKLSDAIIEEFDSVREDVQKNLFQPLALRQGNLEARCQEILNDSL